MTNYSYYANIRSLSVVDPINGIYTCKYYVMDQPTVLASTKFWHEGMSTGTPLESAPPDNAIPGTTLIGVTIGQLQAALQNQCQSLAARLSAMAVTPLSVSSGTIMPVTVTY